MKRVLSTFWVFILIFSSLTACDSPPSETETSLKTKPVENNLKIIATVFPQYDFVRQIAGGKADISMLIRPGAESHSFEPTPQDIKNIQEADLFIYTGGENDVWVEDVLNSMGDKKPDTLRLMTLVPTVTEEVVEGMTDSHSGHAHKRSIDEHVWTSPKNAINIVEKITSLMMEKDQENANFFKDNSATYIDQLAILDNDFRAVVDTSKRKTLLFGDRFPFRYFADEYGLDYYAAFTGCSTETEISAASIAFLIKKVKAEELPVVFVMELSNEKIADIISESTAAQKLTMYSCHNITKDQMKAGATYLSMMKENVKSLRIALN